MRMTIVGSNPRAGGSECILFGHVGCRSGRFMPIAREPQASREQASQEMGDEFSALGGWEEREMRPGAALGHAAALVASSAAHSCRTTGRLAIVAHRWSGVVQIHDIGHKYTIDLYSEETRLVLLDAVNEIVVDVTGLASTFEGVLSLPDMTVETIARHVLEAAAWFRFLERDAWRDPRLTRRTIERFRSRPGEALRRRLVSALLPAFNTRAAAISPPPPAPPVAFEDTNRLRDEVRLLTAAVEGLALRAAANN